ncbi:MAG: winged helix-turn-helix domain-containing protein [Candidatus Aenigmatarchaeota archaeon]
MSQLDRDSIRALASDTRVAILKSLGERRKMPSELAREHNLAPSTVVEHLSTLEKAGLVRKVETGHKWIYYELSEKGKNLAAPKWPVQFAVILGLGVLLIFSSLNVLYSPAYMSAGSAGGPVTAPSENVKAVPNNILSVPPQPMLPPDLVSPASAVFLIGLAVAAWSSWQLWKMP